MLGSEPRAMLDIVNKKAMGKEPLYPYPRYVGVNYMAAIFSLGRTISVLPGKGTMLGKECKDLSYYSLVSLTLFLFQEHIVLISTFRILQLLSPLPRMFCFQNILSY